MRRGREGSWCGARWSWCVGSRQVRGRTRVRRRVGCCPDRGSQSRTHLQSIGTRAPLQPAPPPPPPSSGSNKIPFRTITNTTSSSQYTTSPPPSFHPPPSPAPPPAAPAAPPACPQRAAAAAPAPWRHRCPPAHPARRRSCRGAGEGGQHGANGRWWAHAWAAIALTPSQPGRMRRHAKTCGLAALTT